MNGPPPEPAAAAGAATTRVEREGLAASALVALGLLALQAAGAALLTVLLLIGTQNHRRQEWLGESLGGRRVAAGLVLAGLVVGLAVAFAGVVRQRPWGRSLTYVVEAVVVAGQLLRIGSHPERALFGVTLAVAIVVLVAVTPRSAAPSPVIPERDTAPGSAPPPGAPPAPEP